MPSAQPSTPPPGKAILGGHEKARPRYEERLKYSGSLDAYEYSNLTPIIGREIPSLQITKILGSPDADTLVRDLAITISERGVVFLRNQDVTIEEMMTLGSKLSSLTGCPESSGLHIHPLTAAGGKLPDQITTISSVKRQKGTPPIIDLLKEPSRFSSDGWHTDITWEPVPSDYTMLHLIATPATGGDTLWASGYEIYDRLSPATQRYLEGLTAIHDAKYFNGLADHMGYALRDEVRGSDLNQGKELRAIHPVIRTNPVTGWKSVYVNKTFTKRIVELTKDESDVMLGYLFSLVSLNHDNQVRFKWRKNDLAIWDNRSTWHTATYDLHENDTRIGNRVVSLGEAPYLDPASSSRRAALKKREEELVPAAEG